MLWMGAIIWFVPFLVSFSFFDGHGKLAVSKELFKSVMIVLSSLVGCLMLYRYFKKTTRNYYIEGVALGISWLIINWLLDVLILVPMSGMSIRYYFESIGLGYLQIPVICMAMGFILQLKTGMLSFEKTFN